MSGVRLGQMMRKHITWSMCLAFTVLHSTVGIAVLGLVLVAGRLLAGSWQVPEPFSPVPTPSLLGEFVFYLVLFVTSLAPFFGVMWSYIYVSRYNLRIPWSYCRTCGYDLTGNESGRCPECGTAIKQSPAREKAR